MGTAATVIILCACQRINYRYASPDPALETHIRGGGAYSTLSLSLDIYLEGRRAPSHPRTTVVQII